MSHVYPNRVAVVRWEGRQQFLRPDQRWDAEDPLVEAYPALFTSDAATVHRTTSVESATRAPGETRQTRQTRRRKPTADTE